MNDKKVIDESRYLDPVFKEYGMEVYTYNYIEMLRKEVLECKKKGKRSWNLIPQAGFQEKVLTSPAFINRFIIKFKPDLIFFANRGIMSSKGKSIMLTYAN